MAKQTGDTQELTAQLLEQAKTEGVELIGPDGLLSQLTTTVLETALEAEMTEHLGYDKHDPGGRGSGNSRNGTRTKTVLTPRSAQSRSRCPGMSTPRSTRRSCVSVSAG